ncbi:MAG: helix-turn-helix transcriptional regulator [Cyanothece sp. SIO1E1]|nr:helix-turn-helix transcriptional regulator [Cyanothece sp. SIO1E1]
MAHDHETSTSFMKLRKKVGLTQRQVADALGVTTTTISSWETGIKEPRLDFLQTRLLMELYQCSIDELAKALEELRAQKNRTSS